MFLNMCGIRIIDSLLKAVLFSSQIFPANALICIAGIYAVGNKENPQKV